MLPLFSTPRRSPLTVRLGKRFSPKFRQRDAAHLAAAFHLPPDLDAFLKFIQGEFDRADRATKIDPGRVTARRLNRAEYENTVRDLLGVEFSATEQFPPDDSGYGFDTISDVLTVSPALMQKYLAAAENIASRAVGADPAPKPGVFNKKAQVRRINPGTITIKDQVEYDGLTR